MKVSANKANWSGETATVTVNVSKKSFKYNGYTWTIKNIKSGTEKVGDSGKFDFDYNTFELHGEGWEDALESFTDIDSKFDLEKAVKRSIVYISNYV